MDWQTIGSRLAPILTTFFGLGTLFSFWTIYSLRRAAKATNFGFVREQTELRVKRLWILAFVLFALTAASGALWVVSVERPEILPSPLPTMTPTAIPSPTPRTPTATFTPTATPTITPTPTETPIPPDADLPPALLTPFPTEAVDPDPDAKLAELVLAAGEENNAPVDPGASFAPDTEHVYAFFTFEEMARDVPWIHIWYAEVEGEWVEWWSSVELWGYGSTAGTTWRYINVRPGRYELHVYVGRRLQQKIPFVVRDSE